MELRNRSGERLDHTFHEASKSEFLVILAHGLTGDKDRELIQYLAEGLAKKGWPTLRFSFSGNGQSEGKFEDSTISKEVREVQSVLDQYKGTKKVAYIGYSMGGAVGALTAGRDDRLSVMASLAGMVQTKTFCETEFGEVTPNEGCMWEEASKPLSQAFVDDLHQIQTTLPAVQDIKLPWLLIHGLKDDVVLAQDSRELFNHLKGKKKHLELETADHSFEGHWDTLILELDEWFTQHLS